MRLKQRTNEHRLKVGGFVSLIRIIYSACSTYEGT